MQINITMNLEDLEAIKRAAHRAVQAARFEMMRCERKSKGRQKVAARSAKARLPIVAAEIAAFEILAEQLDAATAPVTNLVLPAA